MSEHLLEVDVAAWVEKAREVPFIYQQRQTIEIVLNTIAITVPLNTKMFLKGGVLMGLAIIAPAKQQILTSRRFLRLQMIVMRKSGENWIKDSPRLRRCLAIPIWLSKSIR